MHCKARAPASTFLQKSQKKYRGSGKITTLSQFIYFIIAVKNVFWGLRTILGKMARAPAHFNVKSVN